MIRSLIQEFVVTESEFHVPMPDGPGCRGSVLCYCVFEAFFKNAITQG
jgi:tRNA pseudouridine-54 N-methylase